MGKKNATKKKKSGEEFLLGEMVKRTQNQRSF